MRVQGLDGDQVGLEQGPHAHATSMRVGVVAVVQGGQSGKQACLLARS
jgi:hypothetical protein